MDPEPGNPDGTGFKFGSRIGSVTGFVTGSGFRIIPLQSALEVTADCQIRSRPCHWTRVETKIFVFVFSQKFSRKFIFAFRKNVSKSYENFHENKNVWENWHRKPEILWNILRCQIRMVHQNKSDNSNGHALLFCLLRMVLQNKSDKCTLHALHKCQIRMVLQNKSDNSTVHHALQNRQIWMVLQNKSDSSNGHELKSSNFRLNLSFWRCLSQKRTHFRENFLGNKNFCENENFRENFCEILRKFFHFRFLRKWKKTVFVSTLHWTVTGLK
jgi:hypothetical protein